MNHIRHEYLFTSRKQEFFEPWIKVNRNNILPYTFTTLITTIWPKNLGRPRTYNVSFPPGSVFPLEQILRYKSNVRSVGLADLIESAVDVSRMGKSFSRAANKTGENRLKNKFWINRSSRINEESILLDGGELIINNKSLAIFQDLLSMRKFGDPGKIVGQREFLRLV